MPPMPDRPPASGRRMLSRIASPFAPSRSRHITDFSVNPDDEHRRYSPGDPVTGHVWLRVAKAIRVTHLAVCLHGFVQVYKNPGSPVEGVRPSAANVGSGRAQKSGEHFGNGFASLFEQEVVLCGDGRLAEGAYQFNFEFAFPDDNLPTSIDFERGTISYMITATLTRPNSMSPVSCHRRLTFVERIDISPLYPPKPRTITLAPLVKRMRAKHSTRKLADSQEHNETDNAARSGSNTPRRSDVSSNPSTLAEHQTSASPPPSESSSGSIVSQLQPASQSELHTPRSPAASDGGKSFDAKASLPQNKVITVTMESQAGGCLQGDYIPAKVNVVHTKPVKSLCGVIVTLFRQARVDMRPSAPLGPVEKGKDAKTEEYYPRSMTGLGGLSLSGAGSSHVFRKDLSQAVRPLYVDPQELTAEVRAGVHVPDEAFPTITSVPGAMISFRYYVEVIVDIQGKLHGMERGLMHPSSQRVGANHPGPEDFTRERSAFVPYGSTIVDTAQIRRDRGVVTCTFEVIVGTKDSERKKGKRKAVDAPVGTESQIRDAQSNPTLNAEAYGEPDRYATNQYYDYTWNDGSYYDYGDPSPSDQYHSAYGGFHYEHQPPAVPLPQVRNESEMTEKERIQQAEMRLLPSQPPEFDLQQSGGDVEASAPYLPEDDGADAAHESTSPVPGYGAATSGSRVLIDANGAVQRSRTAPEYAAVTTGSSAPPGSNTSVNPQEIPPQQAVQQSNTGAVTAAINGGDEAEEAVTAPFSENVSGRPESESIHDSHAYATGTSGLPRYER